MKIKTMPLGQLSANFYIVQDESTKDYFVIDPGDCGENAVSLMKEIEGDLKYIIITHAHVDHICALDEVKNAFDVPVVICDADANSLNDSAMSLCNALRKKTPITKADIFVKDGDTLPFGDKSLRFIHTPGHTVGSMCIEIEECIFSGDTIFNLSVGRSDFPGGNFDTLTESIKSKIYSLPENYKIYPGHGDPTTVGYEKSNNPFVRG